MGGTPNSKSTQPRSKSTWDTLYRVYLRVRIIFKQMSFILSSIIKDFKAETRKRPPPTRHRSPGESVRPSVRLTMSNGVLPAHSPLLYLLSPSPSLHLSLSQSSSHLAAAAAAESGGASDVQAEGAHAPNAITDPQVVALIRRRSLSLKVALEGTTEHRKIQIRQVRQSDRVLSLDLTKPIIWILPI